MNIKSFKLTTGEELVAEVIADQSIADQIVIKNPLVVHMMRTPDGPSLAFAQWSMIHREDQHISIYLHAMVCGPVDVLKEVSDSYLQNTSSLLLPPSTPGSILLG